MSINNAAFGSPVLLTSSGQVAGGTAMARTFPGGGNDAGSVVENTTLAGTMMGFYVNSTSAGTIILSAGTATGGTAFTGTITPAIGWNSFAVSSPTGIFATIGGTLSVTFLVVQ